MQRQGVLHLPCSENVLLHVLNRRSSLRGPPSPLCLLDTAHPKPVLTSPMMTPIRALWQASVRLKNGLNYPLCRGGVPSRCVVFAAVVFTFISTCLKCVTISFPPSRSNSPTTLDIRSTLYCKQMLSSKEKCFVCLPLAKPRAQSRLYLSECTRGIVASIGQSTGKCISLPFF